MTRRTAIVVGAVLAAGVLTLPAAAEPPPPPDATAITVDAGAETTGIDVTLPRLSFGSISGRVVASGSGKPIEDIGVVAFFPPNRIFRYGSTGSDGRYQLKLPASATGYSICYNRKPGSALPDGSRPSSGWAPQCSGNRPWSGDADSVPSDATRVSVVAGQDTGHVDAALHPGGALAGRVVRRDTGRGLPTVQVYVRSVGAPQFRTRVTTKEDGRYHVANLPPAPGGYQICFDTRDARTFKSPAHVLPAYVPRCYGTTTWPGIPNDHLPIRRSAHWPRTATRIVVRPGSTRRGINVTVLPAGAIAGRVLDRATGQQLDTLGQISVFDDHGRLMGGALVGGGSPRFKVKYLPSGRFHLCVEAAAGQYASSSGPSYQRMCYRDVLWTDRASLTRAPTVHVERGKTSRGVVVRVRRASSIRGRVTRATDGQPVFATVSLFTSTGKFLADAPTQLRHGGYEFDNVPASRSGYLVCASAFRSHTPPTTPWVQPRCYADGRWDGARRTPPQDATPVAVGAHDQAQADFTLPVGGAVSGQVSGDPASQPVPVHFAVFDGHGHLVAGFGTYLFATWFVAGLSPSSAYRVCVRTTQVLAPKFGATCYWDARWFRPYATPE